MDWRWAQFGAGALLPLPQEPKPILCYVTDRKALGVATGASSAAVASLLRTIARAAAAGVDWIQIREKDLPARELAALVANVLKSTASRAPVIVPVIVNDRLDVAIAAGASGVHLGGESLPVAEIRAWRRANHAGAGFLIGASCHSLDEAIAAERDGADYLFFGPVFPTPSKVSYGLPQGTARLAQVCKSVRVPVLAIGGITAENALECTRSGAAGIAAIRLFQEASDLAATIAGMRNQLEAGLTG